MKTKLNLGSGSDKKADWINIDALVEFEPDLVHDLHQPLPFKNDSVDEILAQDILEHFTKENVQVLIAEISRVLIKGGKLTVRVPNIDDIFKRFENDHETRNEFLYGTTAQTGIFGAHKVGYTPELLVLLMLKNNLKLKSFKKETTNYLVTFEKTKPQNYLKKITYINQSLSMGGAEEFMGNLLTELSQNGIKISAYTTNKSFAKILQNQAIAVYHIPVVIDLVGNWKGLIKALVYFPKALVTYYLILRAEKDSDLLLMSGFTEKIIVGWLAKLFNLASAWIEFGPMHPLLLKFKKLPKALYYGVKNIPEKIIVPTQHTQNHLISGAHLSLSKMIVIPCGREIKTPQGIKQVKNQVVCVSRLEKGKGQDLLLKAFAKVVSKIADAQLFIVGEGDFKAELEELIKKLKLEKHVVLTGWVDDSLNVMKQASLCVFPSMWDLEGFGLVAIEAMALGKPIVAFNRPPINEIVSQEKEGLLADPGDIKDFASKITLLLENKSLRERLGKQGKQTFAKNYTIKQVATNYLEALNEAAMRHKINYLFRNKNVRKNISPKSV